MTAAGTQEHSPPCGCKKHARHQRAHAQILNMLGLLADTVLVMQQIRVAKMKMMMVKKNILSSMPPLVHHN